MGNIIEKTDFFLVKKKKDRNKSSPLFSIIFKSVVKIYAVLMYKIENIPIRKILPLN